LESKTSQETEITRVRAYFDREYISQLGDQGFPALLAAEAFDRDGNLVKEFSLGGSSIKKVNGQYRLEKMKITNDKTDSETTLKFDMAP
jgi:hypothetical protein